jgi:hypothetical protein
MKIRKLNFSPFLRYDGKALVFIRPHGSKIYRLHNMKMLYHFATTEMLDLLHDMGGKQKRGIYIFKKSQEEMELLCLRLSQLEVPAAALTVDTDMLN